jgi:flavin-dependent dehydrogenase
MNDTADTIIVGGGFSGLLAAIHLKELNSEHSVTVLEQGNYPLRHNAFMILPPLTRQLLRRITPLNNYKFNEGRFLIFKIADLERDIVIETVDTAVVNYLDFVQMFYEIAQRMGVNIRHSQRVEMVNPREKLVELQSGERIGFSNAIEASGAADSAKNERVLFSHSSVDQDIYCYPMKCAYTLEKAEKNAVFKVMPTEENLPENNADTIKIGDMNGYIDHFIDIHTRYTVISAISAAETVYGGKDVRYYYRSMEKISDDIKYSQLVRKLVTNDMSLIHSPDFSELLTGILLFGTPYKKLYEYLKQQCNV